VLLGLSCRVNVSDYGIGLVDAFSREMEAAELKEEGICKRSMSVLQESLNTLKVVTRRRIQESIAFRIDVQSPDNVHVDVLV